MASSIDELFPDKKAEQTPKRTQRTQQQGNDVESLFPDKRQQQQPQGERPDYQGEMPLNVALDVLKAFGGGPAVAMSAGYEGMAEGVRTGDMDAAADKVRSVQESGQSFITPKTEGGKKTVKFVGDLMDAGVDIARMPIAGLAGLADLMVNQDINTAADTVRESRERGQFNIAGDAVMDMTGSPAAATATSMAPDVFGLATGAGAARQIAKSPPQLSGRAMEQTRLIGDDMEPTPAFEKALAEQDLSFNDVIADLDRLPKNTDPRTAVLRIMEDKVKRDDFTEGLSTKRVGKRGQMEDDPYAIEAEKQGLPRGDIAAIKSAKAGTQDKMRNMLRIRREISANSNKALETDPANVVGNSAVQRYKFLRGRVKDNRKKMDEIVKGDFGNAAVNMDGPTNALLDQLDRLDVKMTGEQGNPKLDFKGSEISADPAAQNALNETVRLMREMAEGGEPNVRRAHRLKRQLDSMLIYNRSSQELTPAGERAVGNIRQRLNEAIRDKSDEYATLNDEMSTALGAMEPLEDVIGKKMDIDDPNAERALGTALRSILSNNKAGSRQLSAIKNLDAASTQLGKKFNDDLGQLVQFNNILQDQFGSTRRGSFAGNIQSENQRQTRDMMEAGTGRRSMLDLAVDYGSERLNEMRGINEEQRYKALSRLINKRYKKGTQPQGSGKDIVPSEGGQ